MLNIGIDGRLVSYRMGGIARYTIRLTRALARVDHENTYWFFLHRRAPKKHIVDAPNFRTVTMLTPTHHPLEQFLLWLELKRFPLDVLHSPDFIPPLYNIRARRVITVHDLAFMRYPHLLTRSAARYYGQIDRAVRKADHIIAVSQSTRNDLLNLLGVPESKITVIYEAADEVFRPLPDAEVEREIQERYHLSPGYILFVGTIEPRKNLNTLRLAYHGLRVQYNLDPPLVFAGEHGWLADEIYSLVDELSLNDRCHFLGRVSTQELVYLYNGARIYAHPALYEGFGLPPLEAMACGTPAIVSNISSLPEIVDDAALLVDPTDVEAWTTAMHRLLTDDALWQELRDKGLQRAAQFSWERAARETLDVYHKVVQV